MRKLTPEQEARFDEIWGGWPGNKEYPTEGLDSKLKTFLAQELEQQAQTIEAVLQRHKAWRPTCGYESEEEKGFQKGLQSEASLIARDIREILTPTSGTGGKEKV